MFIKFEQEIHAFFFQVILHNENPCEKNIDNS